MFQVEVSVWHDGGLVMNHVVWSWEVLQPICNCFHQYLDSLSLNTQLLCHDTVTSLASKYGVKASVVLLRWAVQQGIGVLCCYCFSSSPSQSPFPLSLLQESYQKLALFST